MCWHLVRAVPAETPCRPVVGSPVGSREMTNPFYERPILNSPYEYPEHHWELDEFGQPTGAIVDKRTRIRKNAESL